MTSCIINSASLRCILLSLYLLLVNRRCCSSFSIESRSWMYKDHQIGYEKAGRNHVVPDGHGSPKTKNTCTPILLLNGFGVGSFHQHRLMTELLEIRYMEEKKTKSVTMGSKKGNEEMESLIYGIDYLGQGRSWPVNCDDGNSESELGLIYSVDTWADQIIHFIEDVIAKDHDVTRDDGPMKIHLVGNSVGGYLSILLASRRPDLIDSVTLLNATPVWGLNLPGWSGHLPPPLIPRKIGRFLFDQIRNLNTIEKYLEAAYHNPLAFNSKLMEQIRGCTEGKGGHAAFASILWSPPGSFPNGVSNVYDGLTMLECDVLLIFGKDDPWCTPAFAKRMLGSLRKRGIGLTSEKHVHRYIELENVGHCPNHEAPKAVGMIVNRWTQTLDRNKNSLPLLDGSKYRVKEKWGEVIIKEIDEDDAQMNLYEKVITTMV
mmetsp:Transcript_18731/g.26386  ORF Transcript_18731/g.26386 Transcript_18731/m.26386 type:complete len:431 (+) Transcript_18731:106-1398(+)